MNAMILYHDSYCRNRDRCRNLCAMNATSFTNAMIPWLLIRRPVALAALLSIAIHTFVAASTGSFAFDFNQARVFVLIAAIVGWADSRRRKEATFFGNLGVPAWIAPVTWAATAIVLEVITAAATSQ